MTKLKDKLSASVRQAKAAQEISAKPQPSSAKPQSTTAKTATGAPAPKSAAASAPASHPSPLYPNRVWPD